MNYWEFIKRCSFQKDHEVMSEFSVSLKLMYRNLNIINQFRDYLERFCRVHETSYAELSSDTILQWLMVSKVQLKEKSLSQKISILSSFFTFGVQEEYFERDHSLFNIKG